MVLAVTSVTGSLAVLSSRLRVILLALLCCSTFPLGAVAKDKCERTGKYERTKYPYKRACSPGQIVQDIYAPQSAANKIPCKEADVEHLISLHWAWCQGWSDDELRKLADDPDNKVWTRKSTNRSKSDKSIFDFAEKLPANQKNKAVTAGLAIMQKNGKSIPAADTSRLLAYINEQNAVKKSLERKIRDLNKPSVNQANRSKTTSATSKPQANPSGAIIQRLRNRIRNSVGKRVAQTASSQVPLIW